VSLDEVMAIRWERGQCRLAMSFALDQTIRFPEMCPSCGANAVRPQVHHHHQAYLAFVNALKIIVQDKGGRFLLEFGAIARRE